MLHLTKILGASVILITAGCKGPPVAGPETTDAEIRIANLGGWYLNFTQQYRRPPKNLEDFQSFVRGIPVIDRVVPDVELEGYYTSPRDGQPWVFRFGVPASGAPGNVTIDERAILIHEQTGKAGRKLVFYASGLTGLLEDAKFSESSH